MISILAPTRGRPFRLMDMWFSARDLADRPDAVELVAYVDQDDESMAHPPLGRGVGATLIYGPRRLLSETWNVCHRSASGDIFMHGNDDVLFRTPGWDTQVREAFNQWPDRIGCVHGRDGIHDAAQATLGFYSKQWVDALGYMIPPYFSCDWGDTWLSWCADQIGRRAFLPDVLTEHMHPAVGKGPIDVTHQERMARGAADDVNGMYVQMLPERQADVGKLRAAILAHVPVHTMSDPIGPYPPL